jgi:hypothetical protein
VLRLPLIFAFALALVACDLGDGIPDTNVFDYHVDFDSARGNEACQEDLDGSAHVPFSLTYRIHFPDVEDTKVDLYWKRRGDANSTYSFFASGTITGTRDPGAIVYAGGPYEEDKGGARVSFKIEGRAELRFGDKLPDGSETYIITDSTDTARYPIGCAYTLSYEGELAAEQGGGS